MGDFAFFLSLDPTDRIKAGDSLRIAFEPFISELGIRAEGAVVSDARGQVSSGPGFTNCGVNCARGFFEDLANVRTVLTPLSDQALKDLKGTPCPICLAPSYVTQQSTFVYTAKADVAGPQGLGFFNSTWIGAGEAPGKAFYPRASLVDLNEQLLLNTLGIPSLEPAQLPKDLAIRLDGFAVFPSFFPPGQEGPFEIMRVDSAFIAVSTVPEPGTLLLLGSSLAGLGGFAWRRRRNN
jgi:hypothetical protein